MFIITHSTGNKGDDVKNSQLASQPNSSSAEATTVGSSCVLLDAS